jgi:hypothetical protein
MRAPHEHTVPEPYIARHSMSPTAVSRQAAPRRPIRRSRRHDARPQLTASLLMRYATWRPTIDQS